MQRRHLVWAFLLLGLLIGGWTRAAWAQSKEVDWRRIDVNITVHSDGSFTVEEILEIEFIGGPFRFGYRDIPADRLESLTDVRVWDEQGDYRALESGVREGPPRTFSVTRVGGTYTIRWFFEPTRDAVRTFHVAYRVQGGLRAYEGGDQLWWQAVFPDRNGPVRESTVTVRAPAEVTAAAAYFVPAEVTRVDATTVRFRARTAIPPGTAFEVRVEWPHGVIPVTPAPWQAAADREAARLEARRLWDQRWRPLANVFVLALALLLLTGGLGGLYLLWYTRGRDKPVAAVAEYLPEPPSDLPPALVGTLLDESADLQDILATLLDLARRGVLEIEERRDALGNPSFRFRLRRTDLSDLQPFERAILNAVMGRHRERDLDDLKNRFYTKIPELQQAIYEAAVKAGLFPENPEAVRTRYRLLGILVDVLAIGLILGVGPLVWNWVDTFIAVPIALFILGAAVLVLASFMPRKTDKGAEEAAKWRAFRRYLEHLDRFGKVGKSEEILDRYLPYAVAMGVEQAFLRTFERTLQAEGREVVWPRWYRPYGPIYTGDAGGGRPPGMGRPAPAGSGGGSGGGLGDLSRGLGRGLSNLSTSLGGMLAAAATTLSSRPASSGSGGGFGGFSGGGSAGGGGGGGGGGGFG